MSKDLIAEKEGYGFTLTQFFGGRGRGICFQITNIGGTYVQLDNWQMMQLVAAFIKENNKGI